MSTLKVERGTPDSMCRALPLRKSARSQMSYFIEQHFLRMVSNDSKITNYKQVHTQKEVSIFHPYFTGRSEESRHILQTTQSLSERRSKPKISRTWSNQKRKPVPVAARSKAQVLDRSPADGFESHWGHGCLSVVSVVCCQVEVSATS